MPKSGDFTYASAAFEAADEYNQDERTATQRAADKAKRAPVTTDFSRWKSDPSGLDFPGVDTPTNSPEVLPKDLKQPQKPELSARASDEAPGQTLQTTTRDLQQQQRQEFGLSPQVQESDPTESFQDELIDPGERRPAGGRRDNAPEGFVDDLATGRDADLAFIGSESEREDDAGDMNEVFF